MYPLIQYKLLLRMKLYVSEISPVNEFTNKVAVNENFSENPVIVNTDHSSLLMISIEC